MNTPTVSSRLPLQQVWPDDLMARYREAGHWRGETFPAFLRERAECYADDIAVVAGDVRLSYAQLWHEAGRIGAGLLALGLQPGERVLVQLGNTAGFITTICGLFRAGLVPVYALPAHRITELVHFANKAEASAYITTDLHDGFDHRGLARALQAEVPALRQVVIDGDAAEFTALEALQGDRSQLPADPDPQSVAFLQISGGSTGLSKLIPRTHDDYIYSFRASNDLCGIDRDSVYLVALPAAHNFPMSSPGFFGALYAGARVVLSPGPGPDAAFPLIARERVTCCGLVPPLALLWAQAAATSKHDLSSLQVLQVGGAKLVPEAARRVIDGLGCTLQQVFGMAEGEVGHLLTRGPYTIRGYHNDAVANARSFTDDGFYRTGDRVQQLPGGYLVVQGRAGDHINRAGEKISAEEIEDHLLAHPGVFDAAVVSIPDEYLGERSCAFVIQQGEPLKAPALKSWMRGRGLAAFKVPDQVVFVDSFDTTAVGKISRRELRAQLRARHLQQTGGTR